jgi:metal-responsive CopG/Arc/MetJ family transcriptional regulator
MRVVTFKIEQDTLELLDKYAIKYKLNRSEAIRKAIETLVKGELEKETVPTAKVEKGERIT